MEDSKLQEVVTLLFSSRPPRLASKTSGLGAETTPIVRTMPPPGETFIRIRLALRSRVVEHQAWLIAERNRVVRRTNPLPQTLKPLSRGILLNSSINSNHSPIIQASSSKGFRGTRPSNTKTPTSSSLIICSTVSMIPGLMLAPQQEQTLCQAKCKEAIERIALPTKTRIIPLKLSPTLTRTLMAAEGQRPTG